MYGNGFLNPYMYQSFNQAGLGSGISRLGGLSGLGKGLFNKFSFTGFLNGASKTLNVVNQAIPIYYQVKPMFSNAKTMFKIMGAVKDDDKVNTTTTNNSINQVNNSNNNQATYYENVTSSNNENPTFFI